MRQGTMRRAKKKGMTMKYSKVYFATFGFAALAVTGSAQPRRAQITGGGDRDRGKCTIEVVVDGVAEVEVRGDTVNIRTLAGQPAQFRRFQCNTIMPADPVNFRFSGVDGRGRQELVREPRGGSPAVIRIEDPQGGADGYTFDLEWSYGPPPVRESDRRYDDRGDRDRPRRMTVERAVKICQDAVADQARDRFRDARIEFRKTAIDDNPGRNDWVVGAIEVRGRGPSDLYRFSCSVNFETGVVRSASIDRDRIRDRDRDRF
jgi:hypothetical protein